MRIKSDDTSKSILKAINESCEVKTESAPLRRYRVSFYVDTDSMNNMDLWEEVDELLKGSGLASANEDIDVELVEELDED